MQLALNIPEFNIVVPTTPSPFCLEAALASLDKLIRVEPTVLYYSHFGKALNALQRLRNYKVQLQLWANIAEEGVKNGWSFELIVDSIIAKDNVLLEHAEFFMSHPIYSKTVLENCIKGFISYVGQKLAK
jgi:hypothetical protein